MPENPQENSLDRVSIDWNRWPFSLKLYWKRTLSRECPWEVSEIFKFVFRSLHCTSIYSKSLRVILVIISYSYISYDSKNIL